MFISHNEISFTLIQSMISKASIYGKLSNEQWNVKILLILLVKLNISNVGKGLSRYIK